ncbi:hypothetical protein PVT71_21800 [Salipiger sp. H15]|uniref:Uncharacterized protein n=1 Tax=Alloyangia sp. H15 TaxID=3029062 RepID=A0AAU8ALV7_9RHOB
MPNAIATLGRERTVATLARRLYALDASDGATQARAERALLRANPRLRSAAGFRSGADIVVPELEGLGFTDAVERPGTGGQGPLDAVTTALREMASRAEDRARLAEERREEIEKRTGDAGFVREARRALPEAVDLIGKARARLETERAQAAEVEQRLQKGIAEALKAVETLRAQGGRDR